MFICPFTVAVMFVLSASASGTILPYESFPRANNAAQAAPLFSELHHPFAIESVLRHPYMQKHNHSSLVNHVEPLYHNTTLTRVARSLKRKTRSIDLVEKLLEAAIGLEVKWLAPLAHLPEHGEFAAGFVFENEWDIFTMTEETGRSWKGQFSPILTNIEKMVTMMGVEGRSCVLRAICELSAKPWLQPGGLTGEMMNVFLRYLTSSEPSMSNEIDGGLDEYVMAGLYGREGTKCYAQYKECPISLLNLATYPSC
ncbi:unnamed protein product [Meganyctiphanes norvegica]|uniref:Uncharacterized protein n=1 Tax=Meganyctiphanes norvegica TaxID=48144 RepID=A0AAV2PW99_MEGNR